MKYLKNFDALECYKELRKATLKESEALAMAEVSRYWYNSVNDCIKANFNTDKSPTDQAIKSGYQPIAFDPFWCMKRLQLGGMSPKVSEVIVEAHYRIMLQQQKHLQQEWHKENCLAQMP